MIFKNISKWEVGRWYHCTWFSFSHITTIHYHLHRIVYPFSRIIFFSFLDFFIYHLNSEISPILKENPPFNFTYLFHNYPISLFPFIEKLLKRVVYWLPPFPHLCFSLELTPANSLSLTGTLTDAQPSCYFTQEQHCHNHSHFLKHFLHFGKDSVLQLPSGLTVLSFSTFVAELVLSSPPLELGTLHNSCLASYFLF